MPTLKLILDLYDDSYWFFVLTAALAIFSSLLSFQIIIPFLGGT